MTTPIRKLVVGEKAHHPSVLNRPLEDVLSGSGYSTDGNDFDGFAKKGDQTATAAALAAEIAARGTGDATTLASAHAYADTGDATEAAARAAADALRLGVYVAQPGEVSVTSTQYPAGDIRRHGATRDGVTEDTTAFAAAKTSANALGIAMTVPSGTYLLDSTVLDVALRIICAPNVTFKLKDNASTLFGDTRCVFFITHSDVQILGTPTIDANRAGQSQTTFNTAGGSAALSWWGIKVLGTALAPLSGITIAARVINATDWGCSVRYVDDAASCIDVRVETSGAGVQLRDCTDVRVPGITLVSLNNSGAKNYPHAIDVFNCTGLRGGQWLSTDHYGTGTVAGGSTLSNWVSGATFVNNDDCIVEVVAVETRQSDLCNKGVGVSTLSNRGLTINAQRIVGYSDVSWEDGGNVRCTFTNVDIDGRYQANPDATAGLGWYQGNSGFYGDALSRSTRPSEFNKYTNVRIRRQLGAAHALYTARRNDYVNISGRSCRYGLYVEYQALDTANNFSGQPVKDIQGNSWVNADYSFNELQGGFCRDGRDVTMIGVRFNNNCQANSISSGARADGATAVGGGGLHTTASLTGGTLVKSGWELVELEAQDTQSWTDAVSVLSTNPRVLSVVDTSLYHEGQVITLTGAGVAAADLKARINSVVLDEITIDRDVSTFPTIAGTGTISSSGTTLTGAGTAFITQLNGRYFITAGGNTRQIITTSSNTSATLASAFPSNLSGAAFTITKIVTQGIPSQTYGMVLAASLLSPRIIGGRRVGNITADISDATAATTPAQYVGVYEINSASTPKGHALVQTSTGLATPRLLWYNAADDLGCAAYATGNTLTFSTGAKPGSSSGTSRWQYDASALYPASDAGITSGQPAQRWSKVFTYGVLAATVAKTTAYTATTADYLIECNATGGTFAVALPTPGAGNAGLILVVKKTDATANAVTITGTVDGTVNPTLTAQWQRMMIQSNGTAWRQIA